MRSSKYLRQQRLHLLAVHKIRDEDIQVDQVPELFDHLDATRPMVRGLNTDYLNLWRDLLRDNDIDGIERVASGEDDRSAEMRNLSPLPLLLSEDERRASSHYAFAAERAQEPGE